MTILTDSDYREVVEYIWRSSGDLDELFEVLPCKFNSRKAVLIGYLLGCFIAGIVPPTRITPQEELHLIEAFQGLEKE